MCRSLRPDGRIFLNVPVNSPAPDHIYLWNKARGLAFADRGSPFVIDEFIELPPTGRTLAQARKQDLDISCITIAHKSIRGTLRACHREDSSMGGESFMLYSFAQHLSSNMPIRIDTITYICSRNFPRSIYATDALCSVRA